MPVVTANGIQIGYEVQGEGHPLLLIAGVGYSRWFWHRLIPYLSDRYQVIAMDNRGAGESDQPPGPYSVPMMAADAAGLLDALGVTGAYVLGHSLGGFIAQELAIARPDLVAKLVLASTTHGGMKVIPITPEALEVMTNREGDPLELIRRGIAVACAPGFADRHPDLVQELTAYRQSNPVPPAAYQAQVMAGVGMNALTEAQVAERMAALSMPVLILTGDQDKVVPPGNADLLAQKIPHAQVKVIPNTGHLFPYEAPEATAEALRAFLG